MQAISMLERGVRATPRSTTVELLAKALQLEPAQRTALEAAANADRRLVPPPERTTAGLHIPTGLQPPPTPFVGRAREQAALRALLAAPAVRLVTLTGPPGSGKTRLALEVAAELATAYGDGVWAVAGGPLREPNLLMPAIGQGLGLDKTGRKPTLDTVAAHCRARHLLLVLDNLEQLLAATPELLELLASCPRIQILVTSRVRLRARQERELPVPPLDDAAAMALFAERAAAADPGFEVDDRNAAAVAAICRRLDGLPLALELAAPWVRLLSPEQFLPRLDRRLDLLVHGSVDLPDRHRTLRAALAWSCELLAPGPLALLRRLSVFVGGAPLDGVQRVCQAAGALPGSLLHHLAVLADHNLVQRVEAGDGEPTVTMLESVLEYGRELLLAAGEMEATATSHLEHYAEVAARSRDEIRSRGQEPWLRRLRREHDNVRAALAWAVERGQVDAGLRLAGAMWPFWNYDGYRREGRDWIERLLAVGGPVTPAVRAQALHAAGRLAEDESPAAAIAWHEESLAIFSQLDDVRGRAEALRGIALAAGNGGDHARAVSLLEEAVSLLRGLDDPALLASALMSLGVAVAHHEGPGRSRPLYEEALALRRAAGDALGTALCLINLGGQARASGDLELATDRLEEAVVIARRLGSPYYLAAALANLGDLARTRGDVPGAAKRYREGLRLFAGHGERAGAAVCMRWLGWVAWNEERPVLAARLYGAAEELCPVPT